VVGRADPQRLQHAVVVDRGHELRQVAVLLDAATRVEAVGHNDPLQPHSPQLLARGVQHAIALSVTLVLH
jgi:hypothetical protein